MINLIPLKMLSNMFLEENSVVWGECTGHLIALDSAAFLDRAMPVNFRPVTARFSHWVKFM